MKSMSPNTSGLNSPRRGSIRIQLVAIVVLLLSMVLLMSSYRSLSRDFDGIVVTKDTEDALPPQFWVKIAPLEGTDPLVGWTAESIDALLARGDSRRVGISGVVFEKLHFGSRLQKAAFSPLVLADGDSFLDQGIIWGILAVLGVFASIFIYRASRSPREADSDSQTGVSSLLED